MNLVGIAPKGRRVRVAIVASAVAAAAVGPLVVSVPIAHAAAPSVVNTGSSNWTETFASEDDGNRSVSVTFVVNHDPGRRIIGVIADTNFDGTDNTGTLAPTNITAQFLAAGSANQLASSVVRYTFQPPEPSGFSCPSFGGGTRRLDVPLRFRVMDDIGQRSATLNQTWHVIEDEQCNFSDDFPVLESVGQSSTVLTPGQPVSFNFLCDDADSTGSNDRCDYIMWRWRRLNNGQVSAETQNDAEDNTARSFNVSFPSRGVYVVEARLCSEDSCQDSAYWRIGSVLVNDAELTINQSIAMSGAVGSVPPSVNAGDAVTAVSTVTGDTAQVIQWDAQNDGFFERTEYTTPSMTGSTVTHPALTDGQRSQAVDTTGFGLKRVRARVYDNGAIDAADIARRDVTTSGQLLVNARPVASGAAVSLDEDTPTAFGLVATDADAQPVALSYEILDAPTHGSVNLSGNTATYTPSADYHGADSFTFRAKDGPSGSAWAYSNTATVSLMVTPVNDAPVAADQQIATAEDAAVTTTVDATDVDGDLLVYSVGSVPAAGTVTNVGPAFTYVPDANFTGTDAFGVTVDDGNGGTASATVTVVVNPVNDPAVADAQSVLTDEDVPVAITLTGSDADDDALAFAVTDQPDHGTLTGSGATLVYTPDANYHGTDTFNFSVDDGNGADTAAVEIDITAVNDAPIADAQSVVTDEDVSLEITLTGSDVDDDTLDFAITDQPAHGTLTGSGANLVYTPATNFNGTDAFAFSVDDGNGGNATETISIVVDPVNDAPIADAQSVVTDEDVDLSVTLTGSDIDGDALAFAVTEPAHGTLTGVAPNLIYRPDLNYSGADSFAFSIDDGNGGTANETVSITVDPVNDAPVAIGEGAATNEDEAVAIVLSATDVDNDTLTFSVTGEPDHGTLSGTAPSLVFTPDADFNGSDSLTFSVDDGKGGTSSATISIVVNAVNDPAEAVEQSLTTAEDVQLPITLSGNDVDGDALAFAVENGPSNGTLTGAAPDLVYLPNADFNGADSFTFTADDGNGADTATVQIDVSPVNDAPIAAGQELVTSEDQALSLVLSGSDVDGDTLAFAVTSGPTNGTLAGSAPGLLYTPDANFNGTDAFTFSVDDGNGGVHEAVVAITVSPVNDAPIATAQSLTTAEDTALPIALPIALAGSDADGDELAFAVTSGPNNGTLSGSGSSLTYTPAADFSGGDVFAFSVDDGNGGIDTAAVTITVTAVNDSPIAQAQSVATDEDTAVSIVLGGSDVDGDPLTFSVASPPAHGALTGTAPNLIYTPGADYTGADAFTFSVDDGKGGIDTATVSIDVIPAAMIPTALDANPAVIHVTALRPYLRVSATLTNADTGAALAGRTVAFSAGGAELCQAVTAADGTAGCGGMPEVLSALLGGGAYQATYAGDADHDAVTDTGELIRV